MKLQCHVDYNTTVLSVFNWCTFFFSRKKERVCWSCCLAPPPNGRPEYPLQPHPPWKWNWVAGTCRCREQWVPSCRWGAPTAGPAPAPPMGMAPPPQWLLEQLWPRRLFIARRAPWTLLFPSPHLLGSLAPLWAPWWVSLGLLFVKGECSIFAGENWELCGELYAGILILIFKILFPHPPNFFSWICNNNQALSFFYHLL